MKSKTKSARPVTAAQFAKMAPAQQRRAIARDVLARLKAKQLVPTTGTWVSPTSGKTRTTDLQKLLTRKRQCEVCALGGAICGLAYFEDQIQLNECREVDFTTCSVGEDIFPHTRQDQRVREVFGKMQMLAIEYAYEGGGGAVTHNRAFSELGYDLTSRLGTFYDKYPTARARFRAIWGKIAKHPEGLFTV